MSLFRRLTQKASLNQLSCRYFSQIQAVQPKIDVKHTQLFINGEFVNSVSGKTFPTIDPRTEKAICQIQEADKPDIDKAVQAARKAFDEGPWPRMGGFERSKIMWKLAELMDKHRETFAQLESWDNGKPLFWSNVDVNFAVEHVRYYGGWADKIQGKTIPMNTTFGYFHNHTYHEPIGVVGAIIPWNFPLLMAIWKLAPCIATGSTIVIKVAETTPLTALFLGSLLQEAGVPEGVVNFVPGFGEGGAGEALARSKQIDKLAFTGETGTGKIIMKEAAESLIPITLELGGKSPSIVFKDCDIEDAINWHQVALFLNAGQCCTAASRIYVEESIYDEFAEKTVKLANERKVGDPFVEGTDQGPQQNEDQFKKVLHYIEKGKEEGGNLLAGGGREGNVGYFVKPTVFGDCKDTMTVCKEEIFGPVMQLCKFDGDMDKIVQRANNTNYGLAAGIFTRDIMKANELSRRLKAGTVWVNCYDVFDAGSPFGGYKQSGIGREKGEYALHNFTQVKSVIQKMSVDGSWY